MLRAFSERITMEKTILDMLLEVENDKLGSVTTKKLKINRLSEAMGADFVVEVKGLSAKRFMELASNIKDKDGSVDLSKAYDANVKIAVAGLVDPPFKDKGLQEKFGASTPGQLIEKIFNGAEISAMADAITALSGFGGDVIEEIKN